MRQKSQTETAVELYTNTIELALAARKELMERVRKNLHDMNTFADIRAIDKNIPILKAALEQAKKR
jgi:hypothetical protein